MYDKVLISLINKKNEFLRFLRTEQKLTQKVVNYKQSIYRGKKATNDQ